MIPEHLELTASTGKIHDPFRIYEIILIKTAKFGPLVFASFKVMGFELANFGKK